MRDSIAYELDTELITKKEVARRLKVCARQVEIQTNKGIIPTIRIGRCVRYKWLDVLTALETQNAEQREEKDRYER